MTRGQKTSAEQVMLKLRRIEVRTAQEIGVSMPVGGALRAELLSLAQGVRRAAD
jgi:hypothetical protein